MLDHGHKHTFHRVFGIITRALTAPPPNSVVHLLADGERLVRLLADEGIVPTERLEDLLKTFADRKRGRKRDEERTEERLFERLYSIVAPERESALQRLQEDRSLVLRFLYTNLGVHRVDFFVNLYGDFTLCHTHPFLPKDSVIVGPRFDRRGDKVQRQFFLLPWRRRLNQEQAIAQQLWRQGDLTALRAFQWFKNPERLAEWERTEGSCIFISEGSYYLHAFERVLRFGHPRDSKLRARLEIADDLGILRRGQPTKRLWNVLHWLEAAYYAEVRIQKGAEQLEELLKGLELAERISQIRDRIGLIPQLSSDDPIARCVAWGGELPHFAPGDVEAGAFKRGKGKKEPIDGGKVIDQIADFIERWQRNNETLEEFTGRIRPVIDIDVFEAHDFNTLIFPLEVSHRQSKGFVLKGVVFISTMLDFLDDWKKHKTTLEELRTIFTRLGNWNLQTVLGSELLRAERLKHTAELVDTISRLSKLNHAEGSDWTRELGRVVAQRIGEVEPTLADKNVRTRVERLRRDIEQGCQPNERFINDLLYYAKLHPVSGDAVQRRLWVLIEQAFERVDKFLTHMKLPLPVFENHVPRGFEVEIEEESFLHMLDNLLTNAAEAVQDLPDDRRRVRVEAIEQATWREGEMLPEVVVRIVDFGPDLTDAAKDPSKWFEPGFSTKQTEWNVGFGLASAWKTIARHGGRIWAERLGTSTVVQFAIPYL